jgi:RNA polymerase sigma factor (sigma-70 family)
MASNRLRQALEHVLQPRTAVSDGQLLARFVAAHDEAAFAALLRRHGPMVYRVCRRLLRHTQDAEDAFQATFLVLAKKAGSVVKRDSVSSWLYAVAYRTACNARAGRARRRALERQVEELPQPEVAPAEPQDWRPLLDHELSRLPEKYRELVVLCDLEGLSRREAARQLGLPEGTVSSRLATARQMLARRLSRYGLALSGGALAAALSQGAALAQVPARAAVSSQATFLAKGVLRAMFLLKLKVVCVAVLLLGLAAGGVAYRAGGAQAAPPEKRSDSKPVSEVEALRKEVELLRLNLRVVLEKLHTQETELLALRKQARAKGAALNSHKLYRNNGDGTFTDVTRAVGLDVAGHGMGVAGGDFDNDVIVYSARAAASPDPVKEVEAALKALRAARDPEAKRRAADALQKATRRVQEQLKPRPAGDAGK